MLYQPMFPYPYLEAVDIENPKGNVFKCMINPKNKVIGYRIDILSNDTNILCCQIKGYLETTDNTTIQKKAYSVGTTETWIEFENIPEEDSVLPIVGQYNDESWLYILIPSDINLGLENGYDYKWNITLQEETPSIKVLTTSFYDNIMDYDEQCHINKTDIIEKTIMYIKYKNIIKQINDVNNNRSSYTILKLDSSFDSVVKGDVCEILSVCLTSYDYYFKARKMSTVKIDIPEVITSPRYEFTAEIDNNISSYQFDLYSNAKLIDSSENIYSTNIVYNYDGFITGNKYDLKLTVTTNDGEVIVEERNFEVQYDISPSIGYVTIEPDYNLNAVKLNYGSQANIDGVISNGLPPMYAKHKNPTENIPTENNSIHLNYLQHIYWNSINNTRKLIIPDNSTTAVHWHGDSGFNGDIIILSNNEIANERIVVGYDSKRFYYKIGTNDMVFYNPYTNGYANAIAGKDAHSSSGQILSCSNTEIYIPLTTSIQTGMYISVAGQRRQITGVSTKYDVSDNPIETIITIESPFSSEISSGINYFIYDELRCYVFDDNASPEDADIFVENDMAYNYWWLIVILPSEVRFIKTQRYLDTVVSE